MSATEIVAWSYLIGGVIFALNWLQIVWRETWDKSEKEGFPRGLTIFVLILLFVGTVGVWPLALIGSIRQAVKQSKKGKTDGR